jgi:hypothetical protein
MKSWFFLLALMIAACILSRAEEPPCAPLKTKDASILRDFLKEQQSSRQSPCLTLVIKQLGQLRDLRAIHLLVGYLDYLEPGTGPLPDRVSFTWPHYPAEDALFLIGKPASGDLAVAIRAAESPKILRNAIRTYANIYRDDLSLGIRELKKTQLQAKTEDEHRRLDEASQELLRECNESGEKQAQACAVASRSGP